ncbi:MAG: response regulator transcription factor [Proteobacteria bacterium]|nr:response regulator transcription factor [Pseudomonadota bacterium]
MTQKINLSGTVAKMKSAAVAKICKPLFASTDITYFCYLRRYKNGHFTFLPSEISFGSYLFEDGYYTHSWFAGASFDELKSGCTFWDIIRQVSSDESNVISQKLSQSFKLSYGVEIIEKNREYCDFYSFSGNKASIYFTRMNILYQFIYYFREKCRTLLLDAYAEKLQLYNQSVTLAFIPIINVGLDDAKNNEPLFDVNRYYLSGKYEGIFLTNREVEILEKLEEGKSIKCLAESLYISFRTFEHHVTNIKDKLQVSRTTEILQIAKRNRLIP